MRGTVLSLVLISVAVSGMACGAGAPAGVAVPDDLGLPVPAGTYSGEVPVRSRVLVGGLTLGDQTDPTVLSQAFGQDGLPISETGEPMVVGYTYEQNLPGATTTMRVTSVEPVGSSIAVNFDATMALDTGGQHITLTGTAAFTFTPKVDGSLYTTVAWDVNSSSGPAIKVLIDGSGSLVR